MKKSLEAMESNKLTINTLHEKTTPQAEKTRLKF